MPGKLGPRQAPDPSQAAASVADLERRIDIAALEAQVLAAMAEVRAA